jgi:hypothetical protein
MRTLPRAFVALDLALRDLSTGVQGLPRDEAALVRDLACPAAIYFEEPRRPGAQESTRGVTNEAT